MSTDTSNTSTISDADVLATLEASLAGVLHSRARKVKGESAAAPSVNANRNRTVDALVTMACEADMPHVVEPDAITWQREGAEVNDLGIRTGNRVLYNETPGTLYALLSSRLSNLQAKHESRVDNDGTPFVPPYVLSKLNGWTPQTGRFAISSHEATQDKGYAVKLIAAATGATVEQVIEAQRKRIEAARKRDAAKVKAADEAKQRAIADAKDAQ